MPCKSLLAASLLLATYSAMVADVPIITIDRLTTNDQTPPLTRTVSSATAASSIDVGGQTGLVVTSNGGLCRLFTVGFFLAIISSSKVLQTRSAHRIISGLAAPESLLAATSRDSQGAAPDMRRLGRANLWFQGLRLE